MFVYLNYAIINYDSQTILPLNDPLHPPVSQQQSKHLTIKQ
ncbi:hypothetical protein VCHA51O444_10397 [Vibrio chagasii]|nr:hypothetical protein VCHA51O444_10397 [Vibrio chagasii]CAH7337756.1 hypothetical protein VCHA53O474_30207 [Vibrio chagasii]